MIDVMKRLAELDANNKNVVKETTNIEECGMMPMPGMGGSHTPASINMTADSGSELTGMLRDIMQLAGVHQVEPEHLGVEPEPMSLTPEPVSAVGPAIAEPLSGADSMRSVLDKLNPEPAGDGGDDLGPFQGNGDDEEGDDDEGDNPFAGNDAGEEEPEDDEETDEGEYDNSPTEPTDVPEVPANGIGTASQDAAGQPGVGDRNDGKQPKAFATMEQKLMSEYKSFIGEDKDEDTEEGIEDRLKDLDPKNPVNIPAYKRKAASGDSASAAKNTKESIETADILKLAGLK